MARSRRIVARSSSALSSSFRWTRFLCLSSSSRLANCFFGHHGQRLPVHRFPTPHPPRSIPSVESTLQVEHHQLAGAGQPDLPPGHSLGLAQLDVLPGDESVVVARGPRLEQRRDLDPAFGRPRRRHAASAELCRVRLSDLGQDAELPAKRLIDAAGVVHCGGVLICLLLFQKQECLPQEHRRRAGR